jgi:hypothetical protein
MGSKLGFHIQQRRPGWPDVIADTVPAVVKSLEWAILDEWVADEQTDLIKRKRAEKWQGHQVFLLGRHAVATQHLDDPRDRAYEFWERILNELTAGKPERRPRVLERMRLFSAWEGYNEIGTGPDIVKLGQFDAILAKRFHNEGLRYAGGGFSMTKPTLEEWPRYCQALLETVATGQGDRPDFLHLHEYWFPTSDWGSLLTEHGLIDVKKMRAATQGTMLHWRDLYQHPQTPAQLKIPVIISECGWDQAWPQQVGFRQSQRPDLDYFRWLVWYDQELRKPLDGIDYVVGATVFTYGHTSRWASFEVDQYQGRGIMDLLRNYLRRENAQPHDLAWQEAWRRADQQEPANYESHYVLLSQEANYAWRHALDRYLDTFKATNGQSLDDALRLTARRQHITLVGRADCVWGVASESESYLREHHPELLIDRMAAATPDDLLRIANRRADRRDRYGTRDGE